MTAKIALTQGMTVLVDREDLEWLSKWKWHYGHATGYARRNARVGERLLPAQCPIYMHREILKPAAGLECDHINGNKLDNRRRNLRAVTHLINTRCEHKQRRNNTSGYKGVSWNKQHKMWAAYLTVRNESLND